MARYAKSQGKGPKKKKRDKNNRAELKVDMDKLNRAREQREIDRSSLRKERSQRRKIYEEDQKKLKTPKVLRQLSRMTGSKYFRTEESLKEPWKKRNHYIGD